MTDRKTLLKQIRQAGILPTDTVMIHSSLRSMGETEGGADGLIDTFCEYLSDGLLLIPTHTWKNVNRKTPVFDVRSTIPCIGALPIVAAARPDAARSLHPTHSVAAFGKRKEAYIAGEDACRTPTPPDGCWGRLLEENAKILLIGVGHDRNTYIHSIDERANVPNRLTEDEAPFVVIDRNGIPHDQPTKTNFAKGTPDVSVHFVKFTDILHREGATYKAQIGLADTIVCNVRPMTDILMSLFAESIAKNVDLCADETPLELLLGREV